MGCATGVFLAEKLSSIEDNGMLLLWLESFWNDGPNVIKIIWNK